MPPFNDGEPRVAVITTRCRDSLGLNQDFVLSPKAGAPGKDIDGRLEEPAEALVNLFVIADDVAVDGMYSLG